jgi:hypothetical protein
MELLWLRRERKRRGLLKILIYSMNYLFTLPQELLDEILLLSENYELINLLATDYIKDIFYKRNFDRCIIEIEGRFLPIIRSLKTNEMNIKVYKNTIERVYTRLNHLEYRLDRVLYMDRVIEQRLTDIQYTINNILSNNRNG